MKKIIKICLALVLVAACLSQVTFGAFAASKKTDYVREVVLSYGNTPEEAKKWLNDNGYVYVDCNLNEGADDTIFLSKERAVYLGYKTTTNADEAITDMKLMNMNGGYSVQDYKMILEEKKADIQQFIEQFIAVINEYRTNYNNNSPRAKAAYEMLNMIKDDDTGMNMGELLLNKIKEEYSSSDFAALSDTEKKEHADMTTILMQGNSEIVLCIEQILATATDTNSTLWLDRFANADDYDTMLEKVMDEENVDPAKAENILATRYDDDAKIIAGMAESYRTWLKDYIDSDVKVTDSDEKVNAYLKSISEEEQALWCTEGAQYEILNGIAYDDETTLLDLFLDEELDITGEDTYMLYPIVSVLSDGQRASLDFVCGYQFFAMGLNTDTVTTNAKLIELANAENGSVSVYEGIDRSIYSDEVALTGDAYSLQTSTDKDYSANWFDEGLSEPTKILGIVTAATITVTIGAWITHAVLSSKAKAASKTYNTLYNEWYALAESGKLTPGKNANFDTKLSSAKALSSKCSYWSSVFFYAGIGLSVISIVLSGITLWKSYNELKSYYKTDFTPIPLWMVDQGINEKDEKIFTYYEVAKCNRVESNFTADNTSLLKDFGDVNGDVGKQWLALYTTTDKNAGNPILAQFKFQKGNSNVPGEYTALSLFGSKSAQNLTDEKSGFTYNDDLGGIYLFYNTDTSVFAGSAITTGVWFAVAGGVVVLGVIALLVVRNKKKKSLIAE